MSKGRRSFNFLKQELTPYQLNLFCRKIAVEFMNINTGHPRDYITRTFWISQPCYYDCMNYAVSRSLVTENEFDKMECMTAFNQIHNTRVKNNLADVKEKVRNTGVTPKEYDPEIFVRKSKKKYDELREARKAYIDVQRKTVTDKQKQAVTIEYAKGKKSLMEIAMLHDIPYPAVSYMIEEAIINNLVEDSTVKLLQDMELRRALDKGEGRGPVLSKYLRYKLMREENAKAQVQETKA